MDIMILLAVACAPGAFIISFIYLRDKFEPEPVNLLVKSFFFGCASTVIAIIGELFLSAVFNIDESSLSDQALNAFIIVALVEEGSKFIFVRGILYKNRNFNEPYDGIIYSVMVSMGFATLENIMYTFENGVGVGITRMFTAVPAHATFAVLMGYFLGKEKFTQGSNLNGLLALVSATLLHGAYDYSLFVQSVEFIWLGAIASLIIGFILGKKAIKLHQQASPFQNGASPTNPQDPSQPDGPGGSTGG